MEDIEELIKQWLPLLVMSGRFEPHLVVLIIPLIQLYKYLLKWFKRKPIVTSIKISHHRWYTMPRAMTAICWYIRETLKARGCTYKLVAENSYFTGNKFKDVFQTFILDTCPAGGINFLYKGTNMNILLAKTFNENILEQTDLILSHDNEETILEFIKEVCKEHHVHKQAVDALNNEHTVYVHTKDEWISSCPILQKTFENVFLNGEILSDLVSDLDSFSSSQSYYQTVGIPYKRGYLLYGPPGTGKSSTYYAIANHTKRDLYKLSLGDLSTEEFKVLVRNIPTNSVVAIDDIDRIKSTNGEAKPSNIVETDSKTEAVSKTTETKSKTVTKSETKSETDVIDSLIGINIATFLEVFDGYDYLDNCIIVLTTNFKEKLDDALIRPGRADKSYNINYPDHNTVKQIFKYFFPDEFSEIPEKYPLKSTAEIITRIIMPNRSNYQKCISLLLE